VNVYEGVSKLTFLLRSPVDAILSAIDVNAIRRQRTSAAAGFRDVRFFLKVQHLKA
jgi:hypothetical protein